MLVENLSQIDAGWSPDGKQIVFGRGIRERSDVQAIW
jgi:hypothetical protein